MEENLGLVTIHPTVLTTIVRLATLSIPGVARLSDDLFDNVGRIIKGASTHSVNVVYENGLVTVDLFIIAKPDANMRTLGETLQAEVTKAIHKIVGLEVGSVNVHIEDVELPAAAS
jgi:uncharacterized alkaline shock family protein YloU